MSGSFEDFRISAKQTSSVITRPSRAGFSRAPLPYFDSANEIRRVIELNYDERGSAWRDPILSEPNRFESIRSGRGGASWKIEQLRVDVPSDTAASRNRGNLLTCSPRNENLECFI